jgi:hypothetical protein
MSLIAPAFEGEAGTLGFAGRESLTGPSFKDNTAVQCTEVCARSMPLSNASISHSYPLLRTQRQTPRFQQPTKRTLCLL